MRQGKVSLASNVQTCTISLKITLPPTIPHAGHNVLPTWQSRKRTVLSAASWLSNAKDNIRERRGLSPLVGDSAFSFSGVGKGGE